MSGSFVNAPEPNWDHVNFITRALMDMPEITFEICDMADRKVEEDMV